MLSQQQADDLIATEKVMGDAAVELPIPGETLTIAVQSVDKREQFQFDIERGRRNKAKWKIQLRYRNVEILARLDIGGPAHPNPRNAPSRRLKQFEGQRIPSPHLQRYVEGFADNWAVPLPQEFTQPDDPLVTWEQFLRYCNVRKIPAAQGRF